nr:hypothetical protein [Sphingomonas sp. CDS-1]
MKELKVAISQLNAASSSIPQLVLSSMDPGEGKSSAICDFLRFWKEEGFSQHHGALIVLSRHEEIRSYVDRAGFSRRHYAVTVAEGDAMNEMGLSDPDAAPILFTTHEKLRRWTAGRSFADADKFHYLGRPRALRIWDESFLPAQPVTVRLDVLKGIPAAIRLIDPKATAQLDAFTAVSDSAEHRCIVQLPQELYAPKSTLAALSDTQKREWNAATSILGREAIILRDNRMGRVLASATAPLPADFLPALVLDASGRLRETYRAMEETGAPIRRLPGTGRSYSRLTVHHWDRASSRSALNAPEARREILEGAASVINAAPAEEWLIIHHQARGGDTVLDELKAQVANPERLHFVNWGRHNATNAYRHVRKVLVLSLWHMTDAAYTAHHIAASGRVPSQGLDRETLSRVAAGEHRHNLLQAICRANVRNGADGVCGDCEAYVIGKAGKDTKALLAETFPGAAIRDWRPFGAGELTGRSLDVAEEIRRLFAAGGTERVRKIDIRKAVGFSSAPELAQVLARPAFKAWLVDEGLALGTKEVRRADRV